MVLVQNWPLFHPIFFRQYRPGDPANNKFWQKCTEVIDEDIFLISPHVLSLLSLYFDQ